MTDKTRIRIAAIVTALFLAGLSAVGLALRSDRPAAVAPPTPAAPAVTHPVAPTTHLTGPDDYEAHGNEPYREHPTDD